MSVINRMFRERTPKTDHTMRRSLWLLLLIVTVNYVRCTSKIDDTAMQPVKDIVVSCTLYNVTHLLQVASICDREISYLIIKASHFDEFPHVFDHFRNLFSVDLSSAGIQSIKSTAFDKALRLTVLKMRENNIQTLPSHRFAHVNNLTDLDISNSSIQVVEKYAFYGLSSLRKLNLSGNKIVSLDHQLFHPLSRLRTLRLGNNKIEIIDKDLFMHNAQLLEVYLSGNNIKSVDPDSFTNCHLMSLDLGSNQLSQLDLSGIKHLRQVIVTNNQLNVLNVPSVVQIILAGNNSIADIHSTEQNELMWLSLSSNHFTNFLIFTNFKNLQFLDLSKNHLQHFDFADIEALTNLRELSLIGNNFPEISVEDLVTNLPNLRFIYLSTKHWPDSYVDQLVNDLKNHSIGVFQDLDDIPDDDSSVVTTIRPIPVTSRIANRAFTIRSPISDNVEQQLSEIRKKFSDQESRTGVKADANSKKIDNWLADVEEQLKKSDAVNDAEWSVSSFKVYEVLVIVMAGCATVFVMFKLIIHSKRMVGARNKPYNF